MLPIFPLSYFSEREPNMADWADMLNDTVSPGGFDYNEILELFLLTQRIKLRTWLHNHNKRLVTL